MLHHALSFVADLPVRAPCENIAVITNADTSNTGTVTVLDSARVRSRKEYMTVNHKTGVSAPFKIFSYLKLNPSVSYSETWIKIFQTDQSDSLNINSSSGYRRYKYSAGVNASLRGLPIVEP